jgi:hypothetical protein
LFHIVGRDNRGTFAFRQKSQRGYVVQHSKIDPLMPGSGQQHALPQRNLAVRCTPISGLARPPAK